MTPTYPRLRTTYSSVVLENGVVQYIVRVESKVRKLHVDGKWYKSLFVREYREYRSIEPNMLAYHNYHNFLYDVYVFQLFGKVDPGLEDAYGEPVFELDTDQRSEEERLLKTVKI